MFIPLSLSVGLSMIASFILSQSFVPVISTWILKDNAVVKTSDRWNTFRQQFSQSTEFGISNRKWLVPLYIITSIFCCRYSLSFYWQRNISKK